MARHARPDVAAAAGRHGKHIKELPAREGGRQANARLLPQPQEAPELADPVLEQVCLTYLDRRRQHAADNTNSESPSLQRALEDQAEIELPLGTGGAVRALSPDGSGGDKPLVVRM